MAQTPLFANIAELSALNVFTYLSSRFTVVYVPFKAFAPKTNQLTCHFFTGDLYIRLVGDRTTARVCATYAPLSIEPNLYRVQAVASG